MSKDRPRVSAVTNRPSVVLFSKHQRSRSCAKFLPLPDFSHCKLPLVASPPLLLFQKRQQSRCRTKFLTLPDSTSRSDWIFNICRKIIGKILHSVTRVKPFNTSCSSWSHLPTVLLDTYLHGLKKGQRTWPTWPIHRVITYQPSRSHRQSEKVTCARYISVTDFRAKWPRVVICEWSALTTLLPCDWLDCK